MASRICRECGKRIYSHDKAYSAALASARAFGKKMRIYRCPINPSIFHLTSEGES